MKYKEAKKLNLSDFKRLCGVYPETFAQVVAHSAKIPRKKESFGKTFANYRLKIKS